MTWNEQLGVAVVTLKLQPSEFWGMTPREFDAVCGDFIKAQPGYVEPVTMDELIAMKQRFPDGRSQRKKVH